MLDGIELFAGAKYEPAFGHVVLCGMGGIFVEVMQDVASGLAPLSMAESERMIRSLKGYKMLEGIRGQEGIDLDAFADIVVRLSTILRYATEIAELDLNPILGKGQQTGGGGCPDQDSEKSFITHASHAIGHNLFPLHYLFSHWIYKPRQYETHTHQGGSCK